MKIRDRGITELIPEIEVILRAPPTLSQQFNLARYTFLLTFNTNFTGELQPGQQPVVLIRVSYSDGNTILVPAEMVATNSVKLQALTVDFKTVEGEQTLRFGNLRVNASALGHGGSEFAKGRPASLFAKVSLLDDQGAELESKITECGTISKSISVNIVYPSRAGLQATDSHVQFLRSQLPPIQQVLDPLLKVQFTFHLVFSEMFEGVFRSREGESDSRFQWVTQGTRLQAQFTLPPGVVIFVSVYSLDSGDARIHSNAEGARLVAAGGPESRNSWNSTLPRANERAVLQRLPTLASSASATWEWFGPRVSQGTARKAVFGVVVAADGEFGFGSVLVSGDLGPVSTVLKAAPAPIPRFIPSSEAIQAVEICPGKEL